MPIEGAHTNYLLLFVMNHFVTQRHFANWADHYNGEVKNWSTTYCNFLSDFLESVPLAEQALLVRPASHYRWFWCEVNSSEAIN